MTKSATAEQTAPRATDERTRLVAGVDGSPTARHALRWAIAEAILRGVPVAAVSGVVSPKLVAPMGWEAFAIDRGELVLEARQQLDSTLDRVLDEVPDPPPVLTRVVSNAPAAGALVEESESAALVVVGTRQLHGPARWLGSVSDQVARHALCPVAVIPESSGTQFETGAPIVVGVDGSQNAAEALEWAVAESRLRGCGVRAVNVWSLLDQYGSEGATPFEPTYNEFDARDALGAFVERVLGREVVPKVELEVVCDLPVDGILGVANRLHSSLVVVGARGVGGFRGLLLGSASHRVLVESHRPVVIVRPVNPPSRT